MPCRPGHIEDTGNKLYSMSRRQLLSTSAVVATALGAGGALLSRCTTDDDHEHDENEEIVPMWGMITLYKSDVISLEEARKMPPEEGQPYIQLPFFNNNKIPLTEGQVVGCQVMIIGCPFSRSRRFLPLNCARKRIPSYTKQMFD